MNLRLLTVIVWGLLVPLGFGHGGGLDSRGGHRDSKHGGYHYHPERFSAQPVYIPPPTSNVRTAARTSAKIEPRKTARLTAKSPPKLRYTVLKKKLHDGKGFARVRLEQSNADPEQLELLPAIVHEGLTVSWIFVLPKESDLLLGVVKNVDGDSIWDANTQLKDPWAKNGRFAIREWSNVEGTYKKMATFEESYGDKATLSDDKGKSITIALEKLCDADRQWIQECDSLLPSEN